MNKPLGADVGDGVVSVVLANGTGPTARMTPNYGGWQNFFDRAYYISSPQQLMSKNTYTYLLHNG